MAYMRGDYYLWTGTEEDGQEWLHLWAARGYDYWDQSVWACNEDDGKRREDRKEASGTRVPMSVMDEFVLMRLAELVQEGQVGEAIDRAVGSEHSAGNFGGRLLRKNAAVVRAALDSIKIQDLDPP